MAVCFAPFSISGGTHVKSPELCLTKRNSSPKLLTVQRKSNLVGRRSRSSSICAEYRDSRGGVGGDFLAGFLLGGAVLNTCLYICSPEWMETVMCQACGIKTACQTFHMKIRRSLLNEDEYGFRKAKRPIYYDEGLERTRQTLNEKISQLNSAIDNVSSRLRGGNNVPVAPVENDPEVEATM